MGASITVINYNPETVSTDYDESDRLFFEELSLERVLDIQGLQKPGGVVVRAVSGALRSEPLTPPPPPRLRRV
jgi:hypothetical protein